MLAAVSSRQASVKAVCQGGIHYTPSPAKLTAKYTHEYQLPACSRFYLQSAEQREILSCCVKSQVVFSSKRFMLIRKKFVLLFGVAWERRGIVLCELCCRCVGKTVIFSLYIFLLLWLFSLSKSELLQSLLHRGKFILLHCKIPAACYPVQFTNNPESNSIVWPLLAGRGLAPFHAASPFAFYISLTENSEQ